MFEENFKNLYYKHKDKFIDDVIFDILVNRINHIQGNSYSLVLKKLMNFTVPFLKHIQILHVLFHQTHMVLNL